MGIVSIHGGRLHELKCEAQYFRDIESGKKTFEVRKNDRDFAVGDVLELHEIRNGSPTDSLLRVRVGYILPGGQFGIEPDYVVMSIRPVYGTDREFNALRVAEATA